MAKTVRIIASPGLTSQRIRLYADQDGALVATSEVIAAASGSPLNYQQTIVVTAGEYFATIADSADADNVDHWGYVTITADDPATFDVRGVPEDSLPATAVAVAAVKADTGNLVTRITSTLFDGITSIAAWLGAIVGKTADTDARAEINATTAGANYNETTDSLEALRDRGDAAWTGGGGGSNPVTIPITVIGAAEGELITIKAKCAVTLAFTLPSAPTLGTYILGISDDSGQSLLKVFGTLDGVVLTFAITSKDAARLYEGTHSYDIIEVSGYNPDTDDYADAALIAGAKNGVVVLPLYVSPLG